MDHVSMMNHLLHGINVTLEKRAELEDMLSSPSSLSEPISTTSKLQKIKDLAKNPYLRAAAPGAAAGLGAGMIGNLMGAETGVSGPLLASLIGGLGGAGIHGAINKGWINQKYAPMVQGMYPAVLGGSVLGNAVFGDDHPILGTLGGAVAGGGAKMGYDALLKRFGGLKR
jgi:hypothetical protein